MVSLYCGGSSLWVGLDGWLVKVSWLGKLVSVFWWMVLDFFSLEYTEVCRECSQCLGHTRFVSTHSVCAFPVYTAQASDCSAVKLSEVGPGLCVCTSQV